MKKEKFNLPFLGNSPPQKPQTKKEKIIVLDFIAKIISKNRSLDALKKNSENIIKTYQKKLDSKVFFDFILSLKTVKNPWEFLIDEEISYVFKLLLTMSMAIDKRRSIKQEVIIDALEFIAGKYAVSGWLSRLYYEQIEDSMNNVKKMTSLKNAVSHLMDTLSQTQTLTPKIEKYSIALMKEVEKFRRDLKVKETEWKETYHQFSEERKDGTLGLVVISLTISDCSDLLDYLCEVKPKLKGSTLDKYGLFGSFESKKNAPTKPKQIGETLNLTLPVKTILPPRALSRKLI